MTIVVRMFFGKYLIEVCTEFCEYHLNGVTVVKLLTPQHERSQQFKPFQAKRFILLGSKLIANNTGLFI
jgi:hypothetical protein